MTNTVTRTALAAAGIALAIAAPAWSHHSHAMFDHAKEVTVTGKVTEFVFRNPHVFLYVDVKSDNGEVLNYWLEMSNIPNMIKRGIVQTTFKPGDVVTIRLNPLKDGRLGGNYLTITAADGKTYE
ncbi:MAG: hypothetical protein HYU37_14945 [Acidobacteria bacterium]|nr:hypothetical protein [Acidobacteriota bacterium]